MVFQLTQDRFKKGNLFLALKGKKYNGNKFVHKALKKGAGCIISTSSFKKKNKKIIKIQNPISFLNRFAKLKRKFISQDYCSNRKCRKNIIEKFN